VNQAATLARLAGLTVRERLTRSMPPRVPEPMVMDEEEAVAAFDVADPVLQLPVYRVSAEATSRLLPEGGRLLDLGSGTGRLLAHLASARPDIHATGTDLAERMLTRGRAMLDEERLDGRIELRQADMTALPDDLPSAPDAVSCVWALHHLPTRDDLVRCLAEIRRIRDASGCAVWILDFARLRNARAPEALVRLAPDAPARLRADGVASLRAAWTVEDLRAAANEAGLGDLAGGPNRPLGQLQVLWEPGRDRRPSGHETRWSAEPLPQPSRRLARMVAIGLRLPG
jgi:SAM-dependent methyltransferase